MPIATRAFAATAADKPLTPYSFERRDPGPDDVLIDVKYCGVCHSDLHAARSETGRSTYPLVPGHEIAGVVKAVGILDQKAKVFRDSHQRHHYHNAELAEKSL